LTNEQESYFLRPYEHNQFYLEQKNYLGGLARLGFATDYQSVDPAGIFTFVNPGWDSAVKFRYEQPLGKGAGVIANTAPIVVASELAQQARVQLEALVHKTLAEVELAYWQLEFSQSNSRLHRDFVQEATRILDGEQKRLDSGRGTLPELVRAKERVLRARVAAHRAETNAAVAEQKLRLVMGIQSLDGNSLVATDSSRIGRYYQQLDLALGQSKLRPDVVAQHAAIRAAQANVSLQENKLRPDVTLYFDYAVTGLEENFYNSLQTAGGHSFNEWVVGLTYRRPVGLRGEWASVQKSRLVESRQLSRLAELELKASNDVVSAYQRVRRTEQEMPLHRDRVEAAIQERVARRELYKNGRGDLEALIDAEDRYLEATTEEQVALTAKQAAVTLYRFASGAISCGDGLGRSRVQFGGYGHLQQTPVQPMPALRAGNSNVSANISPQRLPVPNQHFVGNQREFPKQPAPRVPRIYSEHGANMRYSIPTHQGSASGLPQHSFVEVLPRR
jgi:outer membrane protein TolC